MPNFLSQYDVFDLRKVEVPEGIKVPHVARPRRDPVEYFRHLEHHVLLPLSLDEERLEKLNEHFPINKLLDFRQNLLIIKRRALGVHLVEQALDNWELYYWNGREPVYRFRERVCSYAVRVLLAGLYDRDLFVHVAKNNLGSKYLVVRMLESSSLYEVFGQIEAVSEAWDDLRKSRRGFRVLRRHHNRVYTDKKRVAILKRALEFEREFEEALAGEIVEEVAETVADVKEEEEEREKLEREIAELQEEILVLQDELDEEEAEEDYEKVEEADEGMGDTIYFEEVVETPIKSGRDPLSLPVPIPKLLQLDLVGVDMVVDLLDTPRRRRRR